jgi:hypothetical protein
MFESLVEAGFQVEFHSHAEAILNGDFPDVPGELEEVLRAATIPIEEIIAGGGGEAKGTQRLRRELKARNWGTKTFTIVKTIKTVIGEKISSTVEREAVSHKMDHVKSFRSKNGTEDTIAIETEWNNKDPFYDRDLENFKRLHADSVISLGIIITRGQSLHENMRDLIRRFCDERQIERFEDLERWGYNPTAKQRTAIMRRVERKKNPFRFREAFVQKFVSDKFGEATTHWRKLEDRVHRGVGNPCPLVLIGLPDKIVTFGEDPDVLKEIIEAASEETSEGETE